MKRRKRTVRKMRWSFLDLSMVSRSRTWFLSLFGEREEEEGVGDVGGDVVL